MPPIGTFKLFDINLRQNWYSKEVIEESLSRCNVLKINDEEIVKVAHLLGLGDIADIDPAKELLQPINFEDQVQQLISRYKLQWWFLLVAPLARM